tara:strand:- start:1675 stop:2268 length:594 start_codon:yes stop_codon:yes gene_type:complete
MSTVKIMADELGNVIRQSSNNPEFGYIRLTQKRRVIKPNNFVDVKNLSTLIHGKLEDLEATGLQHTKEISGKIYVIEQVTPFSEENPDRDLKYAGTTGVICATQDGEPIYRKTFYTEDQNVSDTLIAHANGDAIREANGTSAKIMKEVNEKQVDLEDSIAEVEGETEVTDTLVSETEVVAETPVEITEDEGIESFDL